MIVFDNVSKVYNSHSVALQNVSLGIAPKEFVAICGASGAGKTTLLRLLIREEEPTEGKILLDGQDISFLRKSKLHNLRRRIGVVFQDYKLLPAKTAFENVAFAMEAAGKSDAEINEDVPQSLELVGLADKMDQFPPTLSGGEKQRVAIARALINRPDVILADEPAANLDPINTWEIVNLLQKINGLGTTVLLATHDKEVVNSLDKRVIVFDKGMITSDKEKGKYLV